TSCPDKTLAHRESSRRALAQLHPNRMADICFPKRCNPSPRPQVEPARPRAAHFAPARGQAGSYSHRASETSARDHDTKAHLLEPDKTKFVPLVIRVIPHT